MIIPVKYLPINIEAKEFNRIIRFLIKSQGANAELKLLLSDFIKIYDPKEKYEFVRLKYNEYYIDTKLDKLISKTETFPRYFGKVDTITLYFGKVIDYNHIRPIPKTKKNDRKHEN